jgi:hypothetical protein
MSDRLAPGDREGGGTVLEAAAIVAVGAAAAAFVAGLGTYLYIRFTQQGRPPGEKAPPRP